MGNLLMVGMGGFLGARARYLLAGWVARHSQQYTPLNQVLGTLFVNATGSFLLAVFIIWVSRRTTVSDQTRLLVATGFGAYTTFSTYSNESIALIRAGDWSAGLGNIILTNALCLLGVLLGITAGSRLLH